MSGIAKSTPDVLALLHNSLDDLREIRELVEARLQFFCKQADERKFLKNILAVAQRRIVMPKAQEEERKPL